LGSDYNFCPNVQDDDFHETFHPARIEILARLGDPNIKVLHFKGPLKKVLTNEILPPGRRDPT
jgi:hypothetical protein